MEHSIRRWEAESENAERLSSRENGLLAILSAVLGLGLFRLSDLSTLEPIGMRWALRGVLTLTVLQVLRSFYKVFLIPRSRQQSSDAEIYASGHLRWPLNPGLHPSNLVSEEEAIRIAFSRTAKAAASLHRRNVRRRESLEHGQRDLVVAIVLTALAVIGYLFCWVPRAEMTKPGDPNGSMDGTLEPTRQDPTNER